MGVSITLGNARTLIENAIVDALAWGLATRSPPAANVAALRAAPSAGVPDRRMRVVTSTGLAWQWQASQLGADDGTEGTPFAQPADVPAGLPGRWCRASSTGVTSAATTGYLAACQNYNDDANDLDVFMQRVFGQVPAMLLSFERIDREHKSSGVVGGIDWCKAHFTLFAVSFNARGRQAARQGSPVPAEAAVDPGTAAMLGDAMIALKGVGLGIDDVAYVEVGSEYTVVKDLARGRFVDALDLTVYYTETLPDPSIVPVSYPHSFNVTYKSAELDSAGKLDTQNDVLSGLQFPMGGQNALAFPLGGGLVAAFQAGTMNFNGTLLAIPSGQYTFPPFAVVYRDVDATGAIYYTPTTLGDAPPPVAYGRIRLGVTVTNVNNIVLDRLLAASLITLGSGPDQYDQPTPITALSISPNPMTVPHGTPFQYTVTGTDADGNTRDVTLLVTWSTDDNGGTNIQPDGVATKASAGTAHVTASLNGVTNTAALTAT